MMKTGFIAGAFDVIHPGYIEMLREARNNCDWLHVAVHEDPNFENPKKLKPILSVEERCDMLLAMVHVDNVDVYRTEAELVKLLEKYKPDVRFLGDDYKDKKITGSELNIPIHYLDRSHGWSTTKFKRLIYEQMKNKI